MHYTELAKELKNKNPEYSNRNDKELVESYLKRYPEEKGLIDFTDDNKLLNVGRSIGQGATFGQGSHLAGLGQAIGGTVYNALHKENPFKDIAKDYTEGREDFKKEYKAFEDNNRALAFGGDLIGGLATGGFGAKTITKVPRLATILNSSKLLQSPITKAALVGGAFGGGYGASNTLGKGFDFGNSIIGAGTGALGGAALGGIGKLVGKTTQKLLGGKEKALLEEGEKALQLEGKEVPQLTNAEKVLLKEGEIPKNVIDVTPSQEIKSNLLPKTEGIKDIVAQETINPLKTGYQIDATDLIAANGMQPKNFRAFMSNPKFQYEASKGLLGRRWGTLQDEAANAFRDMNKEIKNFVSNAYFDIPDDTVIAFKYNEKTPIQLAQEEINKLANKRITVNQKLPLKKAQELLNVIESTITEKDGNIGLNFGNIKDATQQFNALAEMYSNKNNKHAANMFKDIYRVFADYRDTNPLAKRATERYRDFMSINKSLGEIGMDVEKVSNNNNIETRIAGASRERYGQKMNRALDKVLKVLNKYPELNQFADLKDKVQLAQIAYDIRPASNEKIFSWTNLLKHPFQTVGKYGQSDAQDELQALGFRLLTGKVKPEQFKNVDVWKGGDRVNRDYYRKIAYGNILDTLKSKNLNKDIIEEAYKNVLGSK